MKTVPCENRDNQFTLSWNTNKIVDSGEINLYCYCYSDAGQRHKQTEINFCVMAQKPW
jgi:hypothetical protein